MSNTRYLLSELVGAQAIGKFATGDTVTIQVINAKTGVAETLTSNTCTEILTSGIFVWQFSDLNTQPSAFTQFLYIMTNQLSVTRSELADCAGWVQSISGTPLGPADTCTVTTNFFEADGVCPVEPNRLFSQNQDNFITITSSIFLNDRYFKLDNYKPSYSDQTGAGFWILPQGAETRVKLDLIGINKVLTVPAQSTITLTDWIAL